MEYPNITHEYLEIIPVAQKAGNILLKYYERGNKTLSIENKNNDLLDFVTKADKECDVYITEKLRKLYPSDTIISEESYKPGKYNLGGRVWYIDPLDGTKEFMFEGGRFSVMIGLCIDGIPIFGVIYNPLEEKTFVGEKNMGSYYSVDHTSWKQLHVSRINTIQDSTQIVRKMYDEKRDADNVIEKFQEKNIIRDGSIGLRFGRIASGTAEFTINTNRRASKWDTCAPQIILEEAGGHVTDIFGSQLNYMQPGIRWMSSFIGSNNHFHNDIVEGSLDLGTLWGITKEAK